MYTELDYLITELKNESSTLKKINILSEFFKDISTTDKTTDKKIVFQKYFQMVYNPDVIFNLGQKTLDTLEIQDFNSKESLSLYEALSDLELNLIHKKLRGHAAKYFLEELLSRVPNKHRYLIIDLLKKDLKIGMQYKKINAAVPNLVLDKHYMGAIPYSVKKLDNLFKKENNILYSQEKMDGMYSNGFLDVKGRTLRLLTRDMKPIYLGSLTADQYKNINKILKKMSAFGLDDVVFNSEVLISGIDRYTSNGLLNSISKIEKKVAEGQKYQKIREFKRISEEYDYFDLKSRIYFVCWDVINKDEFRNGFSDSPYKKRFQLVRRLLKNNSFFKPVHTKIITSIEEAKKHFIEIKKRGGEGTIVKSRTGQWKSGKPVYQIKLKHEISVELKITGFRQGDPGTKYENTLGAYIVESSCSKIKTKAPGLDEKEREYGWTHKEERLGQIISVVCNGISYNKDGYPSLLHPRFDGIRYDKTEANSFKEILEIDAGALKTTLE